MIQSSKRQFKQLLRQPVNSLSTTAKIMNFAGLDFKSAKQKMSQDLQFRTINPQKVKLKVSMLNTVWMELNSYVTTNANR